MNTMLAGLCNICDAFGHSNFDELCLFIEEVCSHCPGLNGSTLIKHVRNYQTLVKTKFFKLAQGHSSCLELCQTRAFASCSEEHQAVCTDINPNYNVHSSLLQSVESLSDESAKSDLKAQLQEMFKVHYDYLAHLLRTKHQGDYYKYVTKNLRPGEYVMIIDYKMKLELGKRVRKIRETGTESGTLIAWVLCCCRQLKMRVAVKYLICGPKTQSRMHFLPRVH